MVVAAMVVVVVVVVLMVVLMVVVVVCEVSTNRRAPSIGGLTRRPALQVLEILIRRRNGHRFQRWEAHESLQLHRVGELMQ